MYNVRSSGTHHAQPSPVHLEQVLTALPSIEVALACLLREPDNRQALEEGYQHTATIGSIASKIDALALAQMAHGMEGVLGDVLDGYLSLDHPTLSLLQESLGQMRLVVQHLVGEIQDDSRSASTGYANQVVDSTIELAPDRAAAPAHGSPAPSSEDFFQTDNSTIWQQATSSRHQPEYTGKPQYTPSPVGMQRAESALAVLQQFQQQRKTGLVRVFRGEGTMVEEGTIRLIRGQITEAHVGTRHGPEARNRIRQWGTCRFTFEPGSDR